MSLWQSQIHVPRNRECVRFREVPLMSAYGVRRGKAALFQWVRIPPGKPLQPEATGAVMEETKWLKPSVSVSQIGDSASVQAVTRVNAEQALYGAFEVKHIFYTTLHFLYSGFFVRLGIPFLRPDPHTC